MTTTATNLELTDDRERASRATIPAAISSVVVTTALTIAFADSNSERISMVALALVVAALVFGVVVPRGLRHESAAGRALTMGIVGLLLVVPAFWSGLPMILGAGAALLGAAGRNASVGRGKAIVSLVLGALAVVGYLAIYIGDYLTVHGVG